MNTPILAIRVNPLNPDHHIFNNNGTWWCHYTLHLPDYTKRRERVNLHTRSREVARIKRDRLLEETTNPANSAND